MLNQKKANLDEIDIELIAQEMDRKDMEQFLYECFGKTHKLSEYISKGEKTIDDKHEKIRNKIKKEKVKKNYNDIYKEFVHTIRFSKDKLEKIYNYKLMKCFYSKDEIEKFKTKWSE